ncbi:MAG: hypothetical protein HY778_07755 [Betaproteobacteria bacterium]|nr:hypothetical protein [Betaproteobacteria bacterium]
MERQRTLTAGQWLENDAASWRLRSAALQRIVSRLVARDALLRRALCLATSREEVARLAVEGASWPALQDALLATLSLHMEGSLVSVTGDRPVAVGALQIEGSRAVARQPLGTDHRGRDVELQVRLVTGVQPDGAQGEAIAAVARVLSLGAVSVAACQPGDTFPKDGSGGPSAAPLSRTEAVGRVLCALATLAPDTRAMEDLELLTRLATQGQEDADVDGLARGASMPAEGPQIDASQDECASSASATSNRAPDPTIAGATSSEDVSHLCLELAQRMLGESPRRRSRWQVGSGIVVSCRDCAALRQAIESLLRLAWRATEQQEEPCIEVAYRESVGERQLRVSFSGALSPRLAAAAGAQVGGRHSSGSAEFADLRAAATRLGARIMVEPGPGEGATLSLAL